MPKEKKMQKITDLNLKGKRVLVRCDFNVPLREGEVVDDFRIEKTIPTIECIIKKGGKPILMSHLGRPGGERKESLSLAPVQDKLLEHLDLSVTKARTSIGAEIERWTEKMQPGEVLLLENLRFHKGETENDERFARRLSRLGDVYINEAFSVSHRNHASIVLLPEILPSAPGILFLKEIEALSKLRKEPERPLAGIIGGAKLAKKMGPIPGLLKTVDLLFVGGKVGEVLKRYRENGEIEEGLREIVEKIDLADEKMFLPLDVIARKGKICDIGPETIKVFKKNIKKAKTVFWAGPLGNIDLEEFETGSKEIAAAVGELEGFSVAGGGDTVSFLRKNGLDKKFDHISTGGSALLKFLSEGTLPGLEALDYEKAV